MNWKYVTIKGIDSNTPTDFQMDTVGNIVQAEGGVKAVACQKCEKKFDYKAESKERIQHVPIFTCSDCNFNNASGDMAFEHKITTDHNITKTTKPRIVAIDRKLTGSIAHIEKTNDDTIIICGDCVDH